MAYTQTVQWALTLTGSDQEQSLAAIKVLPVVDYVLFVRDTSDKDNDHIHVYLHLHKRMSLQQMEEAVKTCFPNAIQYMEPIKSRKGYQEYIMNKKHLGLEVDAFGNIPPIVKMALTSPSGSTKGFDNATQEQSCAFKLANQVYHSREEAILDFKQRASSDWVFRNAAVMASINRLYPIKNGKRRYELDNYNFPPLDFSNNKTKLLVGPTNIGKTQYALAHFQHPLVVTNREGWSKFEPDFHDGAVIDDMTFTKNNPIEMLHLLDMREPMSQRVLFGNITIPCGFPRIFTTNHESLFWPETARNETIAAYKTRCEVVRFPYDTKLYGGKKAKLNIIDVQSDQELSLHQRLFGRQFESDGTELIPGSGPDVVEIGSENTDEEIEHPDEPEPGEGSPQ